MRLLLKFYSAKFYNFFSLARNISSDVATLVFYKPLSIQVNFFFCQTNLDSSLQKLYLLSQPLHRRLRTRLYYRRKRLFSLVNDFKQQGMFFFKKRRYVKLFLKYSRMLRYFIFFSTSPTFLNGRIFQPFSILLNRRWLNPNKALLMLFGSGFFLRNVVSNSRRVKRRNA